MPQEVVISCITMNVKGKWAKLSAPTPQRHIGGVVVQLHSFLTPCRPDGLLIKYPQFPDVLNALNIQPP
jgi:hypothetical protein